MYVTNDGISALHHQEFRGLLPGALGTAAPSLHICETYMSSATQQSLDSCTSGLGFVGSVVVDNPTAFQAELLDLDLTLTRPTDGFELGTGRIFNAVEIAAHSNTTIEVLFDLSGILQYSPSPDTIGMLLAAAANQLEVHLDGTVTVAVLGAAFPPIAIPTTPLSIPVRSAIVGNSGGSVSGGCLALPIALGR
eukprot:scaffold45072_cov41-Prasinocladus_malaysianus.AAC.1